MRTLEGLVGWQGRFDAKKIIYWERRGRHEKERGTTFGGRGWGGWHSSFSSERAWLGKTLLFALLCFAFFLYLYPLLLHFGMYM
jgi:hypothetical protein